MPPKRIPKDLVPGPWMSTGRRAELIPRRPPPPPYIRPRTPPSVLDRYRSPMDAWEDFMRLITEPFWVDVVRDALHVLDGANDMPLDEREDIPYQVFLAYLRQIRLTYAFILQSPRHATSPRVTDIQIQRLETFVQDLGFSDLFDYLNCLMSALFNLNLSPIKMQTRSSFRAAMYHLVPLLLFASELTLSPKVIPPDLWAIRGRPYFANMVVPFLTEWLLHDLFLSDPEPYPLLPSATGEPLTKRQKSAYRIADLYVDRQMRKYRRAYRRQLAIERLQQRYQNQHGGIFSMQVGVFQELDGEPNVEGVQFIFNDGTQINVRLRY